MIKTVAAFVVLLSIAACILVEPDAKDVAAVGVYNSQLFQLLMPLVGATATLLGFIGLYVQSKTIKRDLLNKAESDKQELSAKTEAAAHKLAVDATHRTERMIQEVRQSKEINESALAAANSTNEKILTLQQQVAEQTKRAPARATDSDARVQKVEITGGAGVDAPLKVTEDKRE